MKRIIWILPIVVAFFSYPFCEEVVLGEDPETVDDTYIHKGEKYQNFGLEESLLCVWHRYNEAYWKISLVKFIELDDYIGDDVEVESATLRLRSYYEGGEGDYFYIDPLLWPFDEFETTWDNYCGEQDEPDYYEGYTIKAWKFGGWEDYEYHIDVTDIVGAWVRETIEHNGFCVRTYGGSISNGVHFRSADYSGPAEHRPALIINFMHTQLCETSLGTIKCLYR